MKRTDEGGGTAPKKQSVGRAPKPAAKESVSKKAAAERAPKKTAAAPRNKRSDDLSLERALDDRATRQSLADRSLESLLDEFGPKDRSLNNIDAIVSPRTTDPTVNLVKGATVRQCAQCSEDVWVAPSTYAAFKGRKMPPIWCAECAMIVAELNSTLRRRPPGRA